VQNSGNGGKEGACITVSCKASLSRKKKMCFKVMVKESSMGLALCRNPKFLVILIHSFSYLYFNHTLHLSDTTKENQSDPRQTNDNHCPSHRCEGRRNRIWE